MTIEASGFGRVVRMLRKSRGIHQTELARRMGIRRPWLSQIETGKGEPTLATIQKMADALDMDVRLHFTPKRRQ